MAVGASFHRYVMAVDRVERLLQAVTQALGAASIEYAIIGGNAVAAWVAMVDDGAVRATKDVDLLIRRDELVRVAQAVQPIGLVPAEVLGVHMFVDRDNPNPKTGVHLVFAGERIRPHYAHLAPQPTQSVEGADGFRIIELQQLVQMKLQAYRFIDRAHVRDLLDVGLIDEATREALPADLRKRLDAVEAEEQ